MAALGLPEGHTGHRDGVPEPIVMPPDAETARLPFEVATVTRARAIVVDLLTEAAAERLIVEDAKIVIGELVMNAVRHGRPTADGTIEVSWAVTAGTVLFRVRDGGEVDTLEATMPSADTVGGRGLAMVDMLCHRWSYDTTDGTTVTADLRHTA